MSYLVLYRARPGRVATDIYHLGREGGIATSIPARAARYDLADALQVCASTPIIDDLHDVATVVNTQHQPVAAVENRPRQEMAEGLLVRLSLDSRQVARVRQLIREELGTWKPQ